MLLKVKFSASRSVEVANLTTVIMSGLDPKKKIDSWTGLDFDLDLDLDSKQRTCRVTMGAHCGELSDNRRFVWPTGNWISGVFFPLKSD